MTSDTKAEVPDKDGISLAHTPGTMTPVLGEDEQVKSKSEPEAEPEAEPMPVRRRFQ